MAMHKVDITGINTSDIKVLTSDEMEVLFKRLKDGDKEARNELVNGNLKLVLSILKRFNKRGENLDDLFQIGCVGLLKAIDNFDLSYGVKFSTYCVPMVLGEIKRYIRDNSSIRISRSVKDISYKALRFKDEFLLLNGYEPSISEIATFLNESEVDVIMALDSLRSPVSLSEPIYDDGGDVICLFDQVEDKSCSRDLDSTLSVDKAISKLSDREQYIINQRFIIGKTQMEIADEIGISQAQISRLEKNALTRIRKMI